MGGAQTGPSGQDVQAAIETLQWFVKELELCKAEPLEQAAMEIADAVKRGGAKDLQQAYAHFERMKKAVEQALMR